MLLLFYKKCYEGGNENILNIYSYLNEGLILMISLMLRENKKGLFYV